MHSQFSGAEFMTDDKRDDIGDRVPNDWLEAAILFVTGIGIFGGLFSLWYLAQQMPQ